MMDALFNAMGFKRVTTQKGNVVTPIIEIECLVCGDHHMSDDVPFSCQTGDGE